MGDAEVRVLLDTNVFVAAVKNPARETGTFRLIASLLARDDIRIVGDEVLAREYLRYAEVFPSPTASALGAAILEKMEIIAVEERFVRACEPYFTVDALADWVHASACLQTGAVLVSNDRHFDRIRSAALVTVWSTSEAIRRFKL